MDKPVHDIISKRRSIRRFKQDPIPFETLERLVDLARVAPSSANLQPLQYIVVDDPQILLSVFAALKWAGYIAPRGNPPEGEKPVAYIVVLADEQMATSGHERDVGASVENILLAALEDGIGSCWMCSIDRDKLREALGVPSHLKIDSVVALGYSAESPVLEETSDSIKYWKDESGTLHVPKWKLKDIIHHNEFCRATDYDETKIRIIKDRLEE